MELLTEKTIDNYSIHDVVLPLPGFDVTFPSYESKSSKLKSCVVVLVLLFC